nr:choice-of-anchor R domain-containing protein [Armatimonas sp.]
MRRRGFLGGLAVLLLTVSAGAVQAQTLLVGTATSPLPYDFDTIADNDYLLGQRFTITTGTWDITSVDLLLHTGLRDADLSIFRDAAGVPDTLLDTDIFPFYTPLGGSFEVATFTNLSVTLTPGTYWLVLGATSPSNTGTLGWFFADGGGINDGLAGDAEDFYAESLDNAATWSVGAVGGSNYYLFELSGVAAAAPEPGTLVLLALGGVLVFTRRRCGAGKEKQK